MREAFRGLVRYPLRTALALFGLAAAVASVVATLVLLDAAHRQGMAVLEQAGALDVVRISSPDGAFRDGAWTLFRKRARLGPADAARFRGAIPWVAGVMVGSAAEFPLQTPTASTSISVRGVSANAARFLALHVSAGRFLTAEEETDGAKVVVLSAGLAEDLFGAGAKAPGHEVLISGQRFEVVGVLAPVKDERGNEEAVGMVPFRAAMERLGTPPVNVDLRFAAGSPDRVADLEEAIRALLPSLQPGVPARSYEVESSREGIRDVEAAARTQAAILGGIAALSLLVTASGVLNVLLVGVKERTREIGTRRALGARRRSILAQFLLESVLLSLPGAALGLGAGIALTRTLEPFFRRSASQALLVDFVVGRNQALVAVALAVLVALGAGLWPAWQAARVEPAEALRYE